MRLIYTDEAGTAANEPVCVVASVIVQGDEQFLHVKNELETIIRDCVPRQIINCYNGQFYIHTTEIYSGRQRSIREYWTFEDRLYFIKSVLSMLFVNDIPVSLGIDAKRDDLFEDMNPAEIGLKSMNQFHHFRAFAKCMEKSDYFLRTYLNNQENGLVICEDLPEMRTFLERAGLIYRYYPSELPAHMLEQEKTNQDMGMVHQSYTYKIENIIDVPYFVKKNRAVVLQLADVCAFAFRHYLTKKANGVDFMLAMLGPYEGSSFVNEPLWFGSGSSGLFNITSYWSTERKAAAARYWAQRAGTAADPFVQFDES